MHSLCTYTHILYINAMRYTILNIEFTSIEVDVVVTAPPHANKYLFHIFTY